MLHALVIARSEPAARPTFQLLSRLHVNERRETTVANTSTTSVNIYFSGHIFSKPSTTDSTWIILRTFQKERGKTDNDRSLINQSTMPPKTIYVGPIIQCKSLTELDINLDGSIGVDENGKVSFVTREHSAQSDPEWLEADVVHLGKNEFLFPGFIGE